MQLLGLHESPSGLVALEEFTNELSQLGNNGSLQAQDILASGSDAEAAQNWMPATSEASALQASGGILDCMFKRSGQPVMHIRRWWYLALHRTEHGRHYEYKARAMEYS